MIVARSQEELDKTASELKQFGIDILTISKDLSQRQAPFDVYEEVKDTDVTITALQPGPTDTDFFYKAQMENSKVVQEGSLADPADVAKDGYDALMSGDDKVISGLKN